MLSNYSITCSHGYRMIDIDECAECVKLEIAKMEVIHEFRLEMERVVEPDDTTTKALLLTAMGHYVSMKLYRIQDAHRVLMGGLEALQTALPAPREERMLAQQQFLTELSYARFDPEIAPNREKLPTGERRLVLNG